MKAFLFLACLVFSIISTYAQTETEEGLLQKLAEATNDSLRVDVYIDLHNITFVKELNKSRDYANKILEIGLRTGSPAITQKGYKGLARCAKKRRDYNLGIDYDLKSLELAKKMNNSDNIVSCYLQLATDYLDNEKRQNGLLYLDTCQKQITELTNPAYKAQLNNLYGWYYSKQNESKIAIPYFKKALFMYTTAGNEKMIAEDEYALADCFINIRQPDSASGYLYQAITIYKKRNSLGRQADCWAYLGKCYILNGNTNKAVESYLASLELRRQSFDSVGLSLTLIDLGRAYLLTKNNKAALDCGEQSETVLNVLQYSYGQTCLQTFWGQYYTAEQEFDKAEIFFKQANKSAVQNDLPELKIENEKYWAQLRYKEKKNKGADSLVYSYIEQLISNREPATINRELNTLIKRNPDLDPATVAVIKLLYSPGGIGFLKEKLGKESLTSISNINGVLNLDPFSLASASFDSSTALSDNKHLMLLETQYKTRIISDSLKIEKQNAFFARQEVQKRNIYLIGSLLGLLLLTTGLYLQYQNRKRAEQDKAKIEMLQNEIHHRVKNNLGVINRLIEVAGKSGAGNVSLQSLQTRVKAIELLHKRLYNDNLTGNIALQAYLQELTGAIQSMFEEDKKVNITVNAPVEVSSKAAEKIGLIINELVTNSYKYAFENESVGSIAIEAKAIDTHEYKIKVADNGIGFVEAKRSSYGMKLIAGLSHELNGIYAFANNRGTEFTLHFKDNA